MINFQYVLLITISTYLTVPHLVNGQQGSNQFHFDNCQKQIFGDAVDANLMCQVRKLEIDGNMNNAPEYVECVFKGLEYMRDGKLYINSIISDLHDVGINNKDEEVRRVVDDCKVEFPGATALDFLTCLLIDHEVKDDFRRAFENVGSSYEQQTKQICASRK